MRRGAVRDVASSAATALLTKRRAFKFENEVRFLWIERGTTDAEVFLLIEPLRCIRQIMLGPLTTPAQAEAIEKSLLGFGFAEDAIARLTIYAPPSVRSELAMQTSCRSFANTPGTGRKEHRPSPDCIPLVCDTAPGSVAAAIAMLHYSQASSRRCAQWQ